jgi:hypothetical protein
MQQDGQKVSLQEEKILQNEIDTFFEYPIFGAGVGKGVEIRKKTNRNFVLSHDEITQNAR